MSSSDQPPQGASTYDAMIYQRQQLQKQQEQQAARDRATQDIAEAQAQFRQDQAAANAKGQNLTAQTITKVDGGPTTIESNFEIKQNPSGLGRSVGTVNGSYIDLTPDSQSKFQEQQRTQFSAHEQSKAEGQARQDYYNSPVLGGLSRLDVFNSEQQQAYRQSNPLQYTYQKHYSVNLEDSISGRRAGQQDTTERYYEPDPTNPYFKQSESEYFNKNYVVKNPAVPFDVSPRAQVSSKGDSSISYVAPKSFGNPIQDFFVGAGENIFNLGKSAINPVLKVGGQKELSYAPDVEGSAVSSLIQAPVRGIKGQSFESNIKQVGADFADIGKGIAQNPAYGIGSLAGTGITTFLTGGATAAVRPAIRGIKEAPEIFKAATTSERVSAQAAKEFGIKDAIETQAFKISRSGEEIPLSQKGSLFFESKGVQLPKQIPIPRGNSLIDVPGTPISIKIPGGIPTGLPAGLRINRPVSPDLFRITTNQGIDDIGAFSLKTGKGGIFQQGISDTEKGVLVGQRIVPNKSIQEIGFGLDIAKPTIEPLKGARAPASAVTDITQNEAQVLPKITAPNVGGKVPTLEGPIVKSSEGIKIAESKPLGFSIAEFDTKKILGFESYAKKSALSEAEKGLFGAPKASKPFEFAKPAEPNLVRTSKAPLETQAMYDFDRSLVRTTLKDIVTKQGAKETTSGSVKAAAAGLGGLGLGFGGGASIFSSKGVSLGFGGATGAERVRRQKQPTFDYSIESLVTPNIKSSVKDFMGNFSATKSRAGLRESSNSGLSLDNIFGKAPRSDSVTRLTSQLQSGSKSSFDLFSGQSVKTDSLAGLFSSSKTSESTSQKELLNTTNTLEIPTVKISGDIPFVPYQGGPNPRRKSKKKTGKKGQSYGRTFKTTNPLSAVIGSNTKLGKAIQKFGDLT